MRRLLVLVGVIVLVDTMFFTALTPLLPHYVHKLDLGKGGAGLLQAMYTAGALFGPVLGAVASFTGTGPAFGAVAGLAVVLAAAALRTPAATPAAPQPVRMLFRALLVRRIQIPLWLCLVPALLFGNLSVLAPLRLSHLGWGAAAVGGTYLIMAAIGAAWAPILGRASDRYG